MRVTGSSDAVDHGTDEIALDFEHESTAEWTRWAGPLNRFHDSTRTQVSIIGADTGNLGIGTLVASPGWISIGEQIAPV